MSDRVYPSSRPAAPTNGGATVKRLPTTTPKPHLPRPQHRPQPNHRDRRSGGRVCCCCCFWSVFSLIILALLASIAGTVLYFIYQPRSPSFSVPSFRAHHLNLTTTSDSSSFHISSLFNFTLTSRNPNPHFTITYEDFTVSVFSLTSGVFLGNGTIPAFVSEEMNQTAFRGVVVASPGNDLDAESVAEIKSDLKRRNGIPVKIEMDTKVKVAIRKFRSKNLGIRITCEGITISIPNDKTPSLAAISNSSCKADLGMKIWKWSF